MSDIDKLTAVFHITKALQTIIGDAVAEVTKDLVPGDEGRVHANRPIMDLGRLHRIIEVQIGDSVLAEQYGKDGPPSLKEAMVLLQQYIKVE